MSFRSLLETVLSPDERTPRFVWLGNIECEEHWRPEGAIRLPGAGMSTGASHVPYLGEMALSLAGPRDLVLVPVRPAEEYLEYLAGLGIEPPGVIAWQTSGQGNGVTQAVLDDPGALQQLSQAAREGYWLLPYGSTRLEADLAERSGLPLAAAPSAVCERVNSKVYSRRLGARLGLRSVPGVESTSAAELAAAALEMLPVLQRGGKLVLKDAMGVSGKGLAVIDSENRLRLLLQSLQRTADRQPAAPFSFVLELWIEKQVDFNYQFIVGKNGQVYPLTLKEAIVRSGVHSGHYFPHTLGPAAEAEVWEAARRLGEALAADGYYGVVGVDGMVGPSGEVYPVLEINARFNMSTYQSRFEEQFLPPGKVAMARHYTLKLPRPLRFHEVAHALREQLFQPGREGLFISCWSTVNAGFAGDGAGPAVGRLYTLLVGRDRHDLVLRDRLAAASLKRFEEG